MNEKNVSVCVALNLLISKTPLGAVRSSYKVLSDLLSKQYNKQRNNGP